MSKGGTWDLLKQTAGFVGCLTNRWLQDMESEHQLTKQAAIEKDIQGHLDRISSLLLEQEAMDASEAPQFDLAVKYQLTRIQELLEDTRSRQQVGAILPVLEDQPEQRELISSNPSHHQNFQQNDVVLGVDRGTRTEQSGAALNKLFSRVRHNRYKEVEAILDTGISPDVRDQHGNSLIILACQNGNKRIAKICLRRCCNMDAQNLRGQTALHYCYAFGYRELGEYLISKGARDDLTNEYGMTCYDGLEPAEVRLHATPPSGQLGSRHQLYAQGRSPLDDDTESLTSTASGFSTDTTTDTYPSCASPTIPSFDIESPIRRSRSLNLANISCRSSAEPISRGPDTAGRTRTASIGEFAEEQARQLEALAYALRALKCRDQASSSSRADDSESSSCTDEPRAMPRRASCLEVPESPLSATLSRRELSDGRLGSAAIVLEDRVADCGDRWAVPVAVPRRLKPTPPPIPPPPTAKRISMPGCGTPTPQSSDSEGSAARAVHGGLAMFSRAAENLPSGPDNMARSDLEEDDDALSARLTWRTGMAGHKV